MGWFSRIFTKQAAAPEQKSLDEALLTLLGGTSPTAAGVSMTASTALSVPAVLCACRAIAEGVAMSPLRVRRGEQTIADHPVAKLLSGDVCEWASGYDFILAMTGDALIRDGGGVALVTRVNNEPRELIRYRPGVVQTTYDETTDEPHFAINGQSLNPRDVINIQAPFGRAPVSFGREAIALAAALEQHGARFFGNSARPSGMLSIKGVASPDTISKIRSAWQLAHGGTKSGGTAIIASDAKYEQLTMSSVDAQYQELRAFQAWASPSNRVVHG